jgi:hypothetical protein
MSGLSVIQIPVETRTSCTWTTFELHVLHPADHDGYRIECRQRDYVLDIILPVLWSVRCQCTELYGMSVP